jgi:HK97 family phage major capsid protein
MKGISEAAEAADRNLTAEETETYERIEGEFDSTSARIERMEKEEGIAPSMTRAAALPEQDPERIAAEAVRTAEGSPTRMAALYQRIASQDRAEEACEELRNMANQAGPETLKQRARKGDRQARVLYAATDEYRDAYVAFLRAGNIEFDALAPEVRAALNVGTGAQGGFTVPTEFLRQLIESERFFGVMRQLSTVLVTAGNGALQIPKVDDANRAVASWTAEAGTFQESEDQFLQATLNAYKRGFVVKLSDEIILDSAFDILGFVAKSAGQALGILGNTAYVTGASGSTTTPEGLFTKATIGRTMPSGNATTISTADELMELYHSVRPAYRPRGSFLFSDTAIKGIRQLKNAQGYYIWQPSLTVGDPDTILGRPVFADPDVAVPAANALCGGFGDVQSAYFIRDVQDVTVKILNELYAGTGQVGYRIHSRTDGDVIDTLAFKTLKNSAT